MTSQGRLFRISGSSRVMTLYGKASPALEPYLARRSLPWVIDGQAVYHWLTRAELLRAFPGEWVQDKDDLHLFKRLKGESAPASKAADDRHSFETIKGYEDLPGRGAGRNPFINLCQPYGCADVVATSPKTLENRLTMLAAKVAAERLLPPDDPCALDGVLNDRRNLRGLQYLAYLAWRDEPLDLPGGGTIAPLAEAERLKHRELFFGGSRPRYLDIAKAIRAIMLGAGITEY